MKRDREAPFTCIYCRRTRPTAVPSKAHIFPYVLGGSVSTFNTVCKQCNNEINREVERPALPLFAFFNSYFNVRGHGGVRPVPAMVRIDGHELATHLDDGGLPARPLVRPVVDRLHGDGFIIYGYSLDELEAKRVELSEKVPTLTWEAVEEGIIDARIELPEPGSVVLRRLAAKVAFEHFAERQGSALALDIDFDEIRTFLRTGEEREVRSVVVADRSLIQGPLTLPVPSHAAYLLGHPANTLLGCFVVFYGLYYYAVLLSNKYPIVAPVDELLFGYPDTRQYWRPRLRVALSPVAFSWKALAGNYLGDAIRTSRAANQIAGEKYRSTQGRGK